MMLCLVIKLCLNHIYVLVHGMSFVSESEGEGDQGRWRWCTTKVLHKLSCRDASCSPHTIQYRSWQLLQQVDTDDTCLCCYRMYHERCCHWWSSFRSLTRLQRQHAVTWLLYHPSKLRHVDMCVSICSSFWFVCCSNQMPWVFLNSWIDAFV